ncbi:MAG TPA: branched-chain amino acid ABC transporter permease, partial [Rhodospirillales bacterium]|nr:branched-chain amino acid ABC transporter permease [Rhodospirillales bacterium]
MGNVLQLLLAGLATGAIYALAAAGFALLWQTARTINFAQGEFVMLPAFFVLAGTEWLGLPLGLAILLALVLALLVLGLLFKRAIVDPLLPQGVLPVVIATIAVGILLKESVKEFYSAEAQPFPSLVPGGTLHLAGAVLSLQDIAVLLVAGLAILAMQLFLSRTRLGRMMQATAQNPEVALVLGIPTRRMVLYTFLLNAALVTLASILIS